MGGRRAPAGRPPGPSGAAPGPARPGRRRLAPDGVDEGPPRQESLASEPATGGRPRIDPRFAGALDPGAPGAGPPPAADPRRRRGGGGGDRPGGRRPVLAPAQRAPHPDHGARVRASPAELLAIAGLSHPRPLVDIDAGQVAARLDAVPSLGGGPGDEAWPTTLMISVVARTPVAVVARAVPPRPGAGTPATGAPGWATVDATGRVLATMSPPPPVCRCCRGRARYRRRAAGWRARPAPASPPSGAGPGASLADLGAAPDSPTGPRRRPRPRWRSWPLCPLRCGSMCSVSTVASGGTS